MKTEQMTEGCVYYDPTQEALQDTQRYYRVLEAEGPAGPWQVENIRLRTYATVRLGQVETFRKVSDEPYLKANLEAYIGQRVRLELKFGSKPSGICQEVRYQEVSLNGQTTRLPVSLLVSGNEWDLLSITSIELAEGPQEVREDEYVASSSYG